MAGKEEEEEEGKRRRRRRERGGGGGKEEEEEEEGKRRRRRDRVYFDCIRASVYSDKNHSNYIIYKSEIRPRTQL